MNEEHLRQVREMPCAVCAVRPAEAHHLKSRGSGGSDYLAVPLCWLHHREIEATGVDTFQAKHGINLWKTVASILDRMLTG